LVKSSFNYFVECSPFKEYVQTSAKPWDLTHLFTQLKRVAPSILVTV
jgi:hypothetical protein